MTKESLNKLIIVIWIALVVVQFATGGIGSPPPFPTDKLSVAIFEETSDRGRLSPGQTEIILGTGPGSLREYVTSSGGELRVIDVENINTTYEAEWVKKAITLPRTGTPWIAVATKSNGFSKALSVNAQETLADVKKVGVN